MGGDEELPWGAPGDQLDAVGGPLRSVQDGPRWDGHRGGPGPGGDLDDVDPAVGDDEGALAAVGRPGRLVLIGRPVGERGERSGDRVEQVNTVRERLVRVVGPYPNPLLHQISLM